MSIEEQLKEIIRSKYKSIKAFTEEIGIPYSTVDNALKYGICHREVSTVIKIFSALDLDIESISSGELRQRPCAKTISAERSLSPEETGEKPERGREVLRIQVPPPAAVNVSTIIRLRHEDAVILADLQARTGRSASELAGMLIRWAAERVVIETD